MGAFNRLWQQIQDQRINRGGAFSKSWEGPFDVEIREGGVTQKYERLRSPELVEEFNQKLQQWGQKVKATLGPAVITAGIGGKKLSKSIKDNYFYDSGEIFRLGFSFRREGIFVHKGVGRGYLMQGDRVVKDPRSLTLGFNRHPKPWFNPVIEQHIQELEEIVHSYAETAILNTVRIYIR